MTPSSHFVIGLNVLSFVWNGFEWAITGKPVAAVCLVFGVFFSFWMVAVLEDL